MNPYMIDSLYANPCAYDTSKRQQIFSPTENYVWRFGGTPKNERS